MKREKLLKYILFRLPIWTEGNGLSLEGIAKEFGLGNGYAAESTQEEIAEFILSKGN